MNSTARILIAIVTLLFVALIAFSCGSGFGSTIAINGNATSTQIYNYKSHNSGTATDDGDFVKGMILGATLATGTMVGMIFLSVVGRRESQ